MEDSNTHHPKKIMPSALIYKTLYLFGRPIRLNSAVRKEITSVFLTFILINGMNVGKVVNQAPTLKIN